MHVNKEKIEDMLKASVERETSKYKDQMQQIVDDNIAKITGDNQQAQDSAKALVDDVFKNLDNPQKMSDEIQTTLETQVMGLLQSIAQEQ